MVMLPGILKRDNRIYLTRTAACLEYKTTTSHHTLKAMHLQSSLIKGDCHTVFGDQERQ